MTHSCAGPGAPVPDAPVPLLFLVADTGGGHRAAALAAGEELTRLYPGRFTPVLCDPLGGPDAPRPLRWLCAVYGPVIRWAPWLWGAAWHLTNSPAAVRLLRWPLLRLAGRPVAAAVQRLRPGLIVPVHPLTGPAAVAARDRHAPGVPVVTLVTDLVTRHASWRAGPADRMIVPGPPGGGRTADPVARPAEPLGLPVGSAFRCGPAGPGERAALRASLGLPPGRLTVLVTGGGEGGGRLARQARALLNRCGDVSVVVVCGRHRRLRARLDRLARRAGGRLTVLGFVTSLAPWLRAADLVAGKAGPATIAEATCCGVPLLLTSQLPGQERGNAALVTAAGAGHWRPSPRRLAAEVARLHADPAALAALREAAIRLGRPGATTAVAARLAELAQRPATAAPVPAAPVPTGLAGAGRG